MNLTRAVLDLIINLLREKAREHADDDDEAYDTLLDAADALADAVDMLAELGEL